MELPKGYIRRSPKAQNNKGKVEHAVRHAIESAWKRGDEREHKICSVIVRRKENVRLMLNLLQEWRIIFYMTQLHFYPDNEEQEDLEGAQKRKSGI